MDSVLPEPLGQRGIPAASIAARPTSEKLTIFGDDNDLLDLLHFTSIFPEKRHLRPGRVSVHDAEASPCSR